MTKIYTKPSNTQISFIELKEIIKSTTLYETSSREGLIRMAHQEVMKDYLLHISNTKSKYEVRDRGVVVPKVKKEALELLCGVSEKEFTGDSLNDIVSTYAWDFFISYVDDLNDKIKEIQQSTFDIVSDEEYSAQEYKSQAQEAVTEEKIQILPDFDRTKISPNIFDDNLAEEIHNLAKSARNYNKDKKLAIEEALRRTILVSHNSRIPYHTGSSFLFMNLIDAFAFTGCSYSDFKARRLFKSIAEEVLGKELVNQHYENYKDYKKTSSSMSVEDFLYSCPSNSALTKFVSKRDLTGGGKVHVLSSICAYGELYNPHYKENICEVIKTFGNVYNQHVKKNIINNLIPLLDDAIKYGDELLVKTICGKLGGPKNAIKKLETRDFSVKGMIKEAIIYQNENVLDIMSYLKIEIIKEEVEFLNEDKSPIAKTILLKIESLEFEKERERRERREKIEREEEEKIMENLRGGLGQENNLYTIVEEPTGIMCGTEDDVEDPEKLMERIFTLE